MRVRRLEIGRWRNLTDLTVDLDVNSDFICLVGENGAGKSNLLELIAFAAAHFGLTGQITPKRPFPLQREQPFKVSVTLDLQGMVPTDGMALEGQNAAVVANWDGTLVFAAHGDLIAENRPPPQQQTPLTFSSNSSTFYAQGTVIAGGIPNLSQAFQLAQHVIGELQRKEQVLHLYIDAERVFPELTVTDAEVLERSRQDYWEPRVIREQAAIATHNLYLEWMRGLLGQQQRMQSEFFETAQRAQREGHPQPVPEDPLSEYRKALSQVLPHLEFVRLDPAERRLMYNSAGAELPYEDLSGGERELAFLVGQMDRFGIDEGLFLLDEPELHLNAELLHRWLAYLRSTTGNGQVWIATHSLEAVEAAGLATTLVLDRDADRTVRRVSALGDRPALATLVPLLGTPAFSLATSTFVLIEGNRPGRERERFVQVLDAEPSVRFLEAGGCREVAAHYGGLVLVASEAEQLRVGAFVDRDHRSAQQVADFEASYSVSVLPVHEIENFFLHPDLLDALLEQGDQARDGHSLLRDLFDPRAGSWIWERVVMQQEWQHPPGECVGFAKSLGWTEITADSAAAATTMLDVPDERWTDSTRVQRRAAVIAAINEYRTLRDDRDQFWKAVCGKEALKDMAAALGFNEPEALESRATRLWREETVQRPPEALALREGIQRLALQG